MSLNFAIILILKKTALLSRLEKDTSAQLNNLLQRSYNYKLSMTMQFNYRCEVTLIKLSILLQIEGVGLTHTCDVIVDFNR